MHKIILKDFNEHTANFEIECSKGFYVRALARDIASQLNICGHVIALRRLSAGKFSEEMIISLDYIDKIVHNGEPERIFDHFLPVHYVLDDILVHSIDSEESSMLRLGQKIVWQGSSSNIEENTVATLNKDKLIAICRSEGGYLHPSRVFNL